MNSQKISTRTLLRLFLLTCMSLQLSLKSNAQTLQMSDFVLFGGNGSAPGCTNPTSPGTAVQIGSSSSINSGFVGSYNLVKTTGPVIFQNDIHSKGKIDLANSNKVYGKISSSNTANASGNIVQVGSNAVLSGNIDVKGNVYVSGGTVSGRVTHPSGTSYTGPSPAGGNVTGTPNLPTLPSLPAILSFPSAGSTNFTSTSVITPGNYGKIQLSGSKTITLRGTGVYVFSYIKNSGNTNSFVFDFQNDPTGTIQVYIHGDVNLGKVSCNIINGGSASRIFTEVHGNGSSTNYNTYAFMVANGASSSNCSKWMGTVWAPYAAISIGSGSGYTTLTGAFWSGTQVNVQCNVTLIHAPFQNCSAPIVNAGLDMSLTCTQTSVQLSGSSNPSGLQYSWTPLNGGNIVSGGSSLTPTVDAAGKYVLTATNPSGGCSASDTVSVILNNTPPIISAGPDMSLSCTQVLTQLQGTSSASNSQFSWIERGGAMITNGSNSATPTVVSPGNYILTVTDLSNGCTAKDSALANLVPCILPYYPPPANGKLDDLIGSELNSLYANYTNISGPGNEIFILQSDSVMVEVIAIEGQYQNILALLQTPNYGMTDLVDNGPNTLIITGKMPIANLLKLDSLPQFIRYARPVYPALATSGLTQSQGDSAMNSLFARTGFNISGEGIKVGVISDSYNTIIGNPALTDVQNGDLPGDITNLINPNPVSVLLDYPFGRRTDEGRAMLQIVHDVAPKSKLSFRTGFISAGDFAEGIKALQRDTCDVIIDDVTYITEPFFQDGVVAKAADLVTSQGVSYFSAAGNYGNKSYAGIFNAAPAPGTLTGSAHDFGGGDIFQNISLTPGTYTIVLQWQDSIYSLGQTQTGTNNDLDIYLTYDNGTTLFGFNRNNMGGDPLEVMPFTVTANANTNIMIVRAAGSNNVNFKYVVFRGEISINEYQSGNSTIVGQANAAGAMAVGAVLYKNTPAFGVNPPTIASFSSIGGTPVNGVVRNKPDFCAPNGVNTTVQLGGSNIDGDLFPNFFGTSAAAPHAGAAAALLLSARKKFYNQTITPSAMRSLLQSTAINMDVAGFDFNTGYGLVDAGAAMSTFAAPNPEIISLTPTDTTIIPGTQPIAVIVQGNFLTTQSVILFRGVPLTTTVISSTQVSATVPAFTGNPPIQLYTPPITPSLNDGGYSDSIFFYAPVKKNVVIVADSKSKKYGEKLPDFTASIEVDGVPFNTTGYTLEELGLDSINFLTPATHLSNVGLYFIRPSIEELNPLDTHDVSLLERFTYSFVDGIIRYSKTSFADYAKRYNPDLWG